MIDVLSLSAGERDVLCGQKLTARIGTLLLVRLSLHHAISVSTNSEGVVLTPPPLSGETQAACRLTNCLLSGWILLVVLVVLLFGCCNNSKGNQLKRGGVEKRSNLFATVNVTAHGSTVVSGFFLTVIWHPDTTISR